MSLTYKKKSKVPKTEPRGTPVLIVLISEWIPATEINCFLPLK